MLYAGGMSWLLQLDSKILATTAVFCCLLGTHMIWVGSRYLAEYWGMGK